jgi:hypothetical protein
MSTDNIDNTSFQISTYIATNLSEVLYGESNGPYPPSDTSLVHTGIELVLYFKTMQLLLSGRGKRKRSDLFYAFFSTIMLFLISVWLVTQVIFNERMWIEFRDYPGGPAQYWSDHISDWYIDFGSTAMIVLQLMTDALMVRLSQM